MAFELDAKSKTIIKEISTQAMEKIVEELERVQATSLYVAFSIRSTKSGKLVKEVTFDVAKLESSEFKFQIDD